jgi:SET domain-containing protein
MSYKCATQPQLIVAIQLVNKKLTPANYLTHYLCALMAIPENKLSVKRSTLPDSGKGLFTKVFIPKGTPIVEYKGTITSWKDVDHSEGSNGYIYYIKRTHVINAFPHKDALARYANDARGLKKVKGILNNAEYKEFGLKVFIVAVKDIPAGGEILVDYGKDYWDIIRSNIKIEKQNKRNAV